MSSKFVFFHVGAENDVPMMLVASIKAKNPKAEIIQCSDWGTLPVPGVSRVHRVSGDGSRLMTFRVAAFADLKLSEPAIYLDTDMLVAAEIRPSEILKNCEILLCRRDFECSAKHSGVQRGILYPEHAGRPLGEVFPFLACATVTRNAQFWGELLEILNRLDDRFQRWYGDQEAMRRWVESASSGRFGFLPEKEYACLPEKLKDSPKALILHFKGLSRKHMMSEIFRKSFMKAPSVEGDYLRGGRNTTKNFTYVIMTPPPNPKSAGITYLNSLAQHLRSIGKNAIQLFTIYPKELLHVWASSTIPEQNHWQNPWQGSWVRVGEGELAKVLDSERTIVIHGENQHFKWYQGLNVVRYYLHAIGGLQKKGVARSDEFKLVWHPMFCENPDHLLSRSMVRANLENAIKFPTAGRSLDVSYLGKAWIHNPSAKRLDGTLELTRTWPSGDDEYFYLLSKTRCLYTFDPATSVIDDAVVMGALPIIMDTKPFSREQWERNADPALAGCYCFDGDDISEVLANFEKHRRVFVKSIQERNENFLPSLKEFCEKAETRFFGSNLHDIGAVQ